jgi:NTE family protein
VVDRLLDEADLHFECLSGTSAGAMNATLCAYGLLTGGRQGAQQLLSTFWQQVARAGALTPFRRSWFDRLEGNWSLDHSPWLALMDVARQFVSPYQTNPLGLNPLQELLEDLVDFAALRTQSTIGVYVAATNVHTGRETIFSTAELDAQRVMASACLPFLFQAVEIDGVPYWDGGYLCNPPLMPLVSHGSARDLVIVPINPCQRSATPRTARDIFNRLNEITFNSSLHKDLDALHQINRLIDSGALQEGEHRRLYLHFLEDDTAMQQLTATSKINTEWEFLLYLHDLGHKAAERWLGESRPCLGRTDSAMPRSKIPTAPMAYQDFPATG